MAATLDLGPQIENLREAEIDRVPRRLGLKRSRHCGQLIASAEKETTRLSGPFLGYYREERYVCVFYGRRSSQAPAGA